jgi:uncharacterized protein YjdB
MNRAFHNSGSRAQKAGRMPSLRKFARAGGLLATVIVLAFSFAACSSNNNSMLTSIVVTPATASIGVAGTQQYVATGTYSNGGTQVITSSVAWASSNTIAATISSPGGLATGVAVGATTISASLTGSLGPVTGSAVLNVAAPVTLTSIAVTPATATIGVGATQQFTATGTYSNGETATLTTETWTSSSAATATISTSGLATAVANGTTTITATCGTVSGAATLTVATLTSIAVTPATATIAVGASQQYTATGTYSNGTSAPLTSETWSSSTTATATISTTGLATGVAAGTTTITATCNGISGIATLTVSTATLSSISVTPADASIAVGGTEQYTATGTYSDGTMSVLTNATWVSSSTSIATIGSTTGLATAIAAGTTTITATSGSVSGNTMLTVTSTGGGNNTLLTGQYALLLSGTDSTLADYGAAAGITADGNGNITMGEIDFVDGTGAFNHDIDITGTYTIGSNGVGTITLTTNDSFFGVGGITTLNVSLTSDTGGLIIEADSFATGTGTITLQNSNSFNVDDIIGGYDFATSGAVNESGYPINAAGAFTADGIGTLSNGIEDYVTGGVPTTDQTFTGAFTGPDLCGRGTVTLSNGQLYAYYSVGGTTLDLLENDAVNVVTGPAVTQASSPSLPAGTYAFAGGGIDDSELPVSIIPLAVGGLFTSDGISMITSGTLDYSDGTSGTDFSNLAITGTWTITNGRGVINITGGDSISQFSFYPTASDGIFLLEIDGATSAFQSSELALAQTGAGNFTAASLTGPYAISYSGVPFEIANPVEQDLVGELTADGVSALTGLADLNVFTTSGGTVTPDGVFTGTYTSATSGRFAGTLTFNSTTQDVEFYVVDSASPNTALFISLDGSQVNTGVMESQTFPGAGVRRRAGRTLLVPEVPRIAGLRPQVRAAHRQAKEETAK